MQLWSQPVYGLKVSLLRHVQSGLRHGSNGVSSITIRRSAMWDLRFPLESYQYLYGRPMRVWAMAMKNDVMETMNM